MSSEKNILIAEEGLDKETAIVDGGNESGCADEMSDAGSVTRREAIVGLGSTAVLLGLGGMRYVPSNPLCRPPGGQNEAHLIASCIRCQRCLEVCPRHVIAPAHVEDGIFGVRTPMLSFDSNYCDYCTEYNGGAPRCAQSCPTGALSLDADATAENTIIGLAVIDTKSCLAYRETGCRFCYDACPYGAISLSDNSQNPHPIVDSEKCNGCGACESVCVSLSSGSIASGTTERAIVVKPLDSIQ